MSTASETLNNIDLNSLSEAEKAELNGLSPTKQVQRLQLLETLEARNGNGHTQNTNVTTPAEELGQIWETDILIEDPAKASRTKAVLQRYIDNGLNVAKKAPTRVERTAVAIVESAKHLTFQKVAHFAVDSAISYAKNMDPRNLKNEDAYWKTSYAIGFGLRSIFIFSGVGMVPVVGGGLKYGSSLAISFGFNFLGDLDSKREIGKVQKSALSVAEKSQKIEEIIKNNKRKTHKISKGFAAGIGYATGIDAVFEIGKHFIEQSISQADWTAISQVASKTGDDLTRPVEFNIDPSITEFSDAAGKNLNQAVAGMTAMAPKIDIDPVKAFKNAVGMTENYQTAQDLTLLDTETAAHLPIYTSEGYKLESIEFEKAVLDAQGRDLVSTKGLMEAMYRDVLTQKAGLGAFDQHNVKHLEFVNAEIALDPDYTKKLASAANLYINHLNEEYSKAFSVNYDTGVSGETFVRVNKAGEVVKFHNLDTKSWEKFFADGWEKYYAPEAEKIVSEAPKKGYWTLSPFGEDNIYKNLTPDELKAANFAKTDINPAQLHSTKGFGEAIVIQQVEGHPHFNPEIEGAEKDLALADSLTNPLHTLQTKAVQAQFNYDNPEAVVSLESGEPTEFFYAAKDKEAIALNLLAHYDPITDKDVVDYADMAKSLAPLVDETSLKSGVVSGDFWQNYTLNDFVSDPDSLFSSLQAEKAFNIRSLAEIILAKEYGIDIEELRQKIAEDPILAAKLEKAIAYFKANNNPGLFDGENIKYKSPITGQFYQFKLPKEEALKKLISLF